MGNSQSESEGERCKAFWDRLIAKYPVEQTYQGTTKRNYRWRELGKLRLVVAQSIMPETKKACVYIRGESGEKWSKTQQRLEPVSDQLKAITGRAMGTEFLFLKVKPFDLTNDARWDTVADWLHKTANAYEEALIRVMR